MHVLILPSWFDPKAPYRVSPFIFEQAVSLHRSGMGVGVLHVGFSGWKVSYTRREVDGVKIVSITIPRILRRARQFSLALLYGLHGILYRTYCWHYGEPAVLHGHSMYAGGICASRLSKSRKIPFVITEHFSGFSLGKLRNWQLNAIRVAVNSCSRVFFVSDTLRHDFEEHIPVPGAIILPNNYSDQLSQGTASLKTADEKQYFCIVGRLDQNKNVAMCLRAYAMLPTKNYDLHILGSGAEQPQLEQLARELKIIDQVRFRGLQSRTDTFAIIKSASALIICSTYETFGMTVLEAAMLGTPIISTRCGGPEEILGEDFGVLVDNDNISDLTQAMHFAVTDRSKFRCDEGFRIVSSTYAPSKIVTRLRSQYTNVIAEYSEQHLE